jgi:hypothetical protein
LFCFVGVEWRGEQVGNSEPVSDVDDVDLDGFSVADSLELDALVNEEFSNANKELVELGKLEIKNDGRRELVW